MYKNSTLWQGLGLVAFGIFFIILTFALFHLGYVKSDRLAIFYGLSALLVAMGAVLLMLSKRMPRQTSTRNVRRKT
jgi:hypothetical protein